MIKNSKKMLILFLFFSIYILSLILISFSVDFKILYNRNIESIGNKNIGTNEILINKVIFRNDNMVIFYRNKDKKSNDFDKEMALAYDLNQNKMLYNIQLNYNYFKNALFYDDNNIIIFTWKPVDIYLFNIKNKELKKIYENEWEKNKIIFTLTDNLCYDNLGNVLSTADLREKDEQITDDIPWSLLKIQDNKLQIVKWFSDLKLKQDLQNYFNNKEISTLEYFSYPNRIFVLCAFDNTRKLLRINTDQDYKGRSQEFKIEEISQDAGVLSDYLIDNESKTDYLLIIKKKGLFYSKIDNNTNSIKEDLVIDKKVLKARFLDKYHFIYFAYEDNKVNLYINTEKEPLINDFPYLLLTKIQKNNNIYTFLASDNKNIAKIQINIK
jgi:hypothetical protein